MFEETKQVNVKECYTNLMTNKKQQVETFFKKKELEHKLKLDYATFLGFKDKEDNADYKKIKEKNLKIIYGLYDIKNKEDSLKIIKEQRDLLEIVLSSFENNEKNNSFFKSGAGKKPSDVEEICIYLKDFLQGDLNNDYITSIIKIEDRIAIQKEEYSGFKKDMGGIIPKDEMKVIEDDVVEKSSVYEEKLEETFKKANNIPIKGEKEIPTVLESDLDRYKKMIE